MKNEHGFYDIGTEVPGFGTIQAVKSGSPRDYLLSNDDNVTSWLDELAIDQILKEKE